jgi:Protein of unknown function (DUF3037)
VRSEQLEGNAELDGVMFKYRIMRYIPNVVRGEYLNIGVLIEEPKTGRVGIRLVEEPREFARIRRFHPEADEALLRGLSEDMGSRLFGNNGNIRDQLDSMNENLSNAIQFSPANPSIAPDLEEELDRLYAEFVAPPNRVSSRIVELTREWMRDRLKDVFKHHGVLEKLTRRVPVSAFTQPGDPFRLDYGYQNDVRGFIHTVSLRGDIQQAKVLVYTAEKIHGHDPTAHFTAITEVRPSAGVPRHQFVEGLFAEQKIEIVAIDQADRFAEELSKRLA